MMQELNVVFFEINMIYVRLAGGLGNQLFQLAAASFLAQAGGFIERVVPLVSGLETYDEPRDPDSIELLQLNNWLLPPTVPVNPLSKELSIRVRAGRWLPYCGISDRNYWRSIGRSAFIPKYLDGYFQCGWTKETFMCAVSRMPVREIAKDVQARIDPKEVVVHIRGGDFLKINQFHVVGVDYYVQAACLAMERGLRHFAVITDDLQYSSFVCNEIRRKVPQIDIRMVACGGSALDDFDALRAASGRIIGNSTFAWWATALGSPSAPTWAPSRFIVDAPRDFFLENELRVF